LAWRFRRKCQTYTVNFANPKKGVSQVETYLNQFKRPYRAEFFIFDSTIKSSLCVTEFRWLSPQDAGPNSEEFVYPHQNTDQYLRTVISIDGNTIGNNLIIDLWPKDQPGEENLDYKVSERLHKLEVIGIKTGGLIIDFQDKNQNHVTTA
jgi:hypothetical protein